MSCDDGVFLFGGVDPEQGCWLNELLHLKLDEKRIDTIGPGAEGPTPRDKVRTNLFFVLRAHSFISKASLISAGAFLLLFGGFGPVFDDPMQAGADDDEDDDEDDEEEEGMDPAKVWKALPFLFMVFIYSQFRWFNDLFVFSTQHKTWRLASVANPPPPRAAHGMCLTAGRIWIFGGKVKIKKEDGKCFVFLVVQSFSRRNREDQTICGAWLSQTCSSPLQTQHGPIILLREELSKFFFSSLVRFDQKEKIFCFLSQVVPSGRSFHCMAAIPHGNKPGSSRFVILGGRDNADTVLADVHVYDSELDAWAQVWEDFNFFCPEGFCFRIFSISIFLSHPFCKPNFCANVPQSFAGSATVRGSSLVLHGTNGVFVAADLSKLSSAKIDLPQQTPN